MIIIEKQCLFLTQSYRMTPEDLKHSEQVLYGPFYGILDDIFKNIFLKIESLRLYGDQRQKCPVKIFFCVPWKKVRHPGL